MKLKIGAEDSAGHTVKAILGQSENAAVYTTEDNYLRWSYWKNNGAVPGELAPAISRFNFLMAETTSFAPKKHKEECLVLLGKSLFTALDSAPGKDSLACFRDYESHFRTLTQQHARTRYVLLCMIVTGICSGITVLLLHGDWLPHETYFYGSVFGTVGACISVMQRANDIDVDWRLGFWPLSLQAFIRIVLGLLFGGIFVLACKSDFLLGAFKDMEEALFLLALVAGLSERMIPDLFARLEVSGMDQSISGDDE